jgi:hypothetical protein
MSIINIHKHNDCKDDLKKLAPGEKFLELLIFFILLFNDYYYNYK